MNGNPARSTLASMVDTLTSLSSATTARKRLALSKHFPAPVTEYPPGTRAHIETLNAAGRRCSALGTDSCADGFNVDCGLDHHVSPWCSVGPGDCTRQT